MDLMIDFTIILNVTITFMSKPKLVVISPVTREDIDAAGSYLVICL